MMKFKVELIIDVSDRETEKDLKTTILREQKSWSKLQLLGSDAVVLDSRCKETEDVELD
jgi:hypothetical protein